jgi:hypothetical protein
MKATIVRCRDVGVGVGGFLIVFDIEFLLLVIPLLLFVLSNDGTGADELYVLGFGGSAFGLTA